MMYSNPPSRCHPYPSLTVRVRGLTNGTRPAAWLLRLSCGPVMSTPFSLPIARMRCEANNTIPVNDTVVWVSSPVAYREVEE